MIYEVLLTDDAAQDLCEICEFIASHDDPAKAEYVLAQIEGTSPKGENLGFRLSSRTQLFLSSRAERGISILFFACHPEGVFCPIASPEGKDLVFEALQNQEQILRSAQDDTR